MSTLPCHPILGPATHSLQAQAADAIDLIDVASPAQAPSHATAIARFLAILAADVRRSRQQARALYPSVRGN